MLASCASTNSELPVYVGLTGQTVGTRVAVNTTYVQAVLKAGGMPVILPPVKDEATAAALLEHVSGILFTGGDDIDPHYYGEEVINDSVEIDADRDTSDLIYASLALKMQMPILSICRGEQLINVALGGSLYQDMPSQFTDTLYAHRQCFDPEKYHKVTLDPDSRIASILGTTTLMTNSNHHQSVKVLAPGLKLVGTTADGVVEAYEGNADGLDVIAVQWHPEVQFRDGDELSLNIFKDFVKRSSANVK